MTTFGARIRDQFFALWHDSSGPQGHEREAARQRLLAEVDALAADPTTRLQGLSLSFFPTARFKQLRFVEAAQLDDRVRGLFARPCAALPELAAVFVAPEEFSYHCFENIIGLDRLFAGLDAAPIRFSEVRALAPEVTRARFEVSARLGARLAQLDTLGLFVPPRDPSRGGQRFIFHCAELAEALAAALREALPGPLLRGFVHVNPVFRCNRFETGDAAFAAHVDSPYYHRARHHVSKYTLLLYLTPGRGEAPLAFAGGPVIREIEANTAFVFAQGLAHEGRPYVDGRKLFLRTELVFEDPQIEHAPGVAELFARACYLDGESVFSPELADLARQAYDRAAAAHWRGPPERVADERYLHKQFRGVHFVTNGYDYWFQRGTLARAECAALALLDLLNVSLGGKPFRELCATVHARQGDDRAWIAALLREQEPPPEPVFAGLNKPALFPEPEERLSSMDFPSSPEFSDPFPEDWDATRSPRVLEVYRRARRWAMRRIFAAPIVMLGKELFLDPDRFVVEGDKIHVLSRESLGPLHFAGAVFFEPADFVGVDVTLDALQPLVPPMSFHETEDTLHLCCDLFRNSWMVSQSRDKVPVPRVLNGTDVDTESAPWLHAAALDLARLRAETGEE
ncbi:hypothetical protein [Nannocystis sp. SCPEA4]|uniref:hypothetical protein n=1 Tax=Nannocystis sp. SCPEA4 TaxID=2996787 RepID=UPI002270D655|nr:hypothetical protein [Nannocystis sp. SCPEA4]MCY1060115.1 hypothetical protein [Nannocystis sp. SCPEA4]